MRADLVRLRISPGRKARVPRRCNSCSASGAGSDAHCHPHPSRCRHSRGRRQLHLHLRRCLRRFSNQPHWPLTYWAMDKARVHSIKVRAAGITPPPDLMNDTRIVGGTEHFAAHCASCHGAPGVPRGDIAQVLYPKPADLSQSARLYTPGELFWIVKNGIKMSGMPAWADHSDEELWGTVAFIEKLPGMSEADYAKLVMESMKQG